MTQDSLLPAAGGGNARTAGNETLCVFNKTRESFLSLTVTQADTEISRLRGLLGKLCLKRDEGIWIRPSHGIHTIGLLFPIDVIYLDADNRVLLAIEHLGRFRVAPIKSRCSSVLELPPRTIYKSRTQVGDQLLICGPEEMAVWLREEEKAADEETTGEQSEEQAPDTKQAPVATSSRA